MRLFAACAPGLEPLLATEVESLGVAPFAVPGGVEYEGDLTTVLRSNLELGLALFVLARVAEFRVTHLPDLVRKVAAVDVSRFVARGQALAVRVRAKASRLYHTGAVEERVRAGIAASLGAPPPEPRPDETGAASLHVRLDRDVCTLSVDTSGESLHRRGYRLATAKAPIREDLARALILVSGWDRASTLVDPLMGSGTLPIEAALLARRLPPGGSRRFAVCDAPCFDAKLFDRLRREAVARALPALAAPVFGSDRDAGAHRSATENAERAGVLADLRLACAALLAAPGLGATAEPHGALVTNPPWGERVGAGSDLRPLYQSIGQVVRRLPPAWRVGLSVGDPRLAQLTGLGLTNTLRTDPGGHKVWFYAR